jgi:hypothetical protein
MAYTESLSPRDLKGPRLSIAQRSETPSEFEDLSGARIHAGEPGSSCRPCLVAMLGTRSNYEWVQHVTLARHAGVTDEEIEKIASDELIITCCWFNLMSRFLESTRVELE